MNAIVKAINYGGMVSFPRDYIKTKLGLNKITTGWEFLRQKYAKHFGFGIEVRGRSPNFDNADALKNVAVNAIQRAIKHYGDMLIDADVQVKEGVLSPEDTIKTGYHIDFDLSWDFSKPVLIEITYDRKNRSYKIMGVVYNHFIDGVPMALYIYLIHNHLILGNKSLLSQSTRTFSVPYRFHKTAMMNSPNENEWQGLKYFGPLTLIPVGSQLDVTDSNIPKLRKKLSLDTGCDISTSSLEIILLSMEMGMTWATDYIAQGSVNSETAPRYSKRIQGPGHCQNGSVRRNTKGQSTLSI